MKVKYAVIIKHAFRDYDYRVDIVEVDESVSIEAIEKAIYSEMLGPFYILSVTPNIEFNRDITPKA